MALCAVLVAACAAPTPMPQSAPDEVASSEIPDPFWDFDPDSNFTINYADVDAILGAMVVDTGRSTREKLPPQRASTGTRLQTKVKRTTANEANRFYFEEFSENEEYTEMLEELLASLESIPDEIPLDQFNRDEQLAYWLNLYNIAILTKLVDIYPERNLKQELLGNRSILEEKFINVSGVPLSLHDIQNTILRWNYDDNPLVIYGLYQGNIGGPNIRRWAYTGESVQKDLVANAKEFVNSNRGTYYSGSGDEFHVSSFYARNLGYFDNRASTLRAHILRYLEGPQVAQLENAGRIVADIDDWTITDVYGSSQTQRVGGSLVHSGAAMQGAVVSTGIANNAERGAGTGVVGNTGPAVSATSNTISSGSTYHTYSTIKEDPRFSRFKRADGLDLPKIAADERAVELKGTEKKAGNNPEAGGEEGSGNNDSESDPSGSHDVSNSDQGGK